MTADRLTRAAAKLRELAGAATPGPWRITHYGGGEAAPGKHAGARTRLLPPLPFRSFRAQALLHGTGAMSNVMQALGFSREPLL